MANSSQSSTRKRSTSKQVSEQKERLAGVIDKHLKKAENIDVYPIGALLALVQTIEIYQRLD